MAGRVPCTIDVLPDGVLGHILAGVGAQQAERGALLLLCSLRLESSEALPDPAPLTALTGLTRLVLEERASDEEGLRILAAATFPRLVAYTVSALVVQMPDGWRCAFQESQLDSDEEFLLIHMEKRGDAGQATACVSLMQTELNWTEEEADQEVLRSLLRTVLPPRATLGELELTRVAVLADHSFVGCAPLLAGMTRLALDGVYESTDGTDAALQSALNGLIQLTPRLHHLVFTGDPPRFHEEEEWAAEGGGGKCLSCGLPPAVTALRHLEALSVNFALLPSLPEGPYSASTCLAALGCAWTPGLSKCWPPCQPSHPSV
ncbi:phage integrase [Micractinium conductrix]|uniref:Phage integrase n=1 Tax=Micractinium conductrix TaxID=554055 RepID=A0A2P6VBW1_9CHLO|nr:phage integrase [Micractinium conductrix]|eukprot:PSC71574.1 phage integrase [Micractinium conductrix]